MLVSWILKALFLGISATATPTTARAPPPLPKDTSSAAQHSLELEILNRTVLGISVEEEKARHILPPRIPASIVEIDSRWPASRRRDGQDSLRLLQLRKDQCSDSASVACAGSNGSGPVCPGCSTCCPNGFGSFQCCEQGFKCCIAANGAGSCCPDDGASCGTSGCSLPPTSSQGVSTVFATSTVMHTVTVSDGSRTTAVIITITQTLTVNDPGKQTQTDTITVTTFQQRVKRTAVGHSVLSSASAPVNAETPAPTVTLYPVAAHDPSGKRLPALGAKVKRGADAAGKTVTSTVTIDVTTTVTVIVTQTRTNTVFATVTVAPNAVTTVFTTTTVFGTAPPPGGSSTQTPGGQPTSPTVAPTSSNGGSGTLPPTTNPSSPAQSSPLPTTSTNPIPPDSSTTLPGITTIGTSPTLATVTSSTPTIVTPTPTPPALPFAGAGLSSDQIAGIALGVVFFVFALLLAAIFGRRVMQKRRAQLAAERQQLTPGTGPISSIPSGLVAHGVTAAPVDPNEVRIVIQPAPKGRFRGDRPRRWPVPPGHLGPTYSMYIEGTTGETTPMEPGNWSVASEFGGSNSPEPSGPATRRASGVPSSGVFSTEMHEATGATGPPFAPGGNGIGGDGQSTDRAPSMAPSVSSSAPATRLQPPPPTHWPPQGGLETIRSPATPGVGRAI